ncbi:L-2-amino-thiazoline-4-carboxylic acid hydrolase [candidate division KSB1 bacterium]
MVIKNTAYTISHLQRREIQAPLVSALLKGFADEFGSEKTFALAKEIICKDAAQSGKELSEKYFGNSFNELLKIVKEVWAEDGIMQIENVRLSKNSLSFDVIRCGYSELYEKLGIKELGTLLSCCRDFAFQDGFNPDIELVRTKTIMDGDDICDFCYRLK